MKWLSSSRPASRNTQNSIGWFQQEWSCTITNWRSHDRIGSDGHLVFFARVVHWLGSRHMGRVPPGALLTSPLKTELTWTIRLWIALVGLGRAFPLRRSPRSRAMLEPAPMSWGDAVWWEGHDVLYAANTHIIKSAIALARQEKARVEKAEARLAAAEKLAEAAKGDHAYLEHLYLTLPSNGEHWEVLQKIGVQLGASDAARRAFEEAEK